jgi:hypothetical protein
MQSVKEIMKKIPNKLEDLVPRKKEDTTIRLIIQQDVAENFRQLYKALEKLTDKDIEKAGSVLNRIFKAVDKRIMK